MSIVVLTGNNLESKLGLVVDRTSTQIISK